MESAASAGHGGFSYVAERDPGGKGARFWVVHLPMNSHQTRIYYILVGDTMGIPIF